MELAAYYAQPKMEAALTEYVNRRPEWRIDGLHQMYGDAKNAFESEQSEGTKQEAFKRIYDNLHRGWQVFRPIPAERCWSASKLYNTLRSFDAHIGRGSGLTLVNISETNRACVIQCLLDLRDMKPMGEYPHMAVSKFLHFYNPQLFPIYDRAIVWDRICRGVFKKEYDHFCRVRQFAVSDSTERFNWYYTLWAATYVQCFQPDTMNQFAVWYSKQVSKLGDSLGILPDITRYFATAFEFVAIGASYSEAPSN